MSSGNEHTLEELRSKIIASMGKKENPPAVIKGGNDDRLKRKRDEGSNGSGPRGKHDIPLGPRGVKAPSPVNRNMHQSLRNNAAGYPKGTQERLSVAGNQVQNRNGIYDRQERMKDDKGDDDRGFANGSYQADGRRRVRYTKRTPPQQPQPQQHQNTRPGASRDRNENRRYRRNDQMDTVRPRNDYHKGTWNSNNSNGRNNYKNSHNTYNNNGNKNKETIPNISRIPVQNSFMAPTIYPNITKSRSSCIIIVSSLKNASNDESEVGHTRILLKNSVETFLKGLKLEQDELKNFTIGPVDEDYCVFEFKSAKTTTMVLSCRSYFNKKLGLSNATWERPNDYIEPFDNLEKLCGGNVLTIEGLDDVKILDLESKIKELLQPYGIVTNCSMFPLMYKEETRDQQSVSQNEEPRNETEGEFTGCVILLFEENIDDKLEPFKTSMKYMRPNNGRLSQMTSAFTFFNLPHMAVENKHPESSILLLMNCVDPLDLKVPEFAQEIEETLRYTVDEVNDIKIIKPNIDYRLNFECIDQGVGNIYLRFTTVDAAKKAMEKLSGTQFNDRSILCSYVDEDDYKRTGVLRI
ncbi:Mud2p NDAI_0C00430 [Naumovozyma dairenensis CBS 421]|uniref:RNA recognition motif domain-containing protein n=1 Tax=Naumovozyma dairenensis (strain ATCC 10597 / BCRC 20456 / CBS 421 / NBRC 0211 / NRRL Y-12639) TaxID=1071378 RepID=G0W7E3_NAUDC|nr:hypothetical protein NDAI_0C00430 [Naumovozyma dairenensis CBS 421]CCD23704.1 hypothetical protein NDAI_0C00430 [Naumovozyma dairenensis CBS 421]